MQITAATFTDPLLRPQLEAYYDKKKNDIYETLKARDTSTLPQEVKFRDADGTEHTAKLIPITAEKVRDALIPFDKWLEFQAENITTQNTMMKQAEESLKRLQRDGLTSGPEMDATKENLQSTKASFTSWQNAMTEIQTYLLSLQEVPTDA